MKRKEIEQKIIQKVREDEDFKKELLSNPKQILKQEFGFEIPDTISVEVLQEKPDKLYLVLPVNKDNMELPDDMLDNVAGGGQNTAVNPKGSCSSYGG